MYGIKSTSLVKAADLVTCLPGSTAVTAVPPVLPAVLVMLYCTPLTKKYLYLTTGAATEAAYTAGKLVIKITGAAFDYNNG